MTDTSTAPTDADIAAGFLKQLQQRPPAEADDAPAVDDEPQVAQDETDQAPDLEADDAADAGEQEFAETDDEPARDLETDHPEPTIQAPLGLTAEQQAAFAQAGPELQQFLVDQAAHQRADYTAKTERLATERRDLEAQSAEVAQQRAQYAQLLQQAAGQDLKPPSARLAEEDPDSYQLELARYNEAKFQQDAVKRELERVQTEAQQQFERAQRAHRERVDAELPGLIPAMRDPEKATAIKAELKQHATSRGISADAYDRASPGELQILYESMMFRKGQTAAKPGKKAPKAMKPGSTRRPQTKRDAAKTDIKRAAQKTAETGDLTHVWGARLRAEGHK